MNAFITTRRVEFMDTDMAGIVHFTAFFRYMETAEHDLFRALGISIQALLGDRRLGWPRVSCRFDFKRPLRYDQEFEVHLTVERIGTSSVTYRADIVCEGVAVACGHSTSVCCAVGDGDAMQRTAIPEDIAEKLGAYLA
jgi:4-hydroxybenzoyl-CoA thioesterase/acyl-CoA thioester hydrolase